ALQNTLNDASDVLNNAVESQQDVIDALDALNDVYDALVNISALASRVATVEAENLQSEDYIEGWDALQTALSAANGILEDDDASQEDVNDALDALNDAYEGLVAADGVVNKSALAAQVTAIHDANLVEAEYAA